jgi:hypothetical protein
MTSSTINWPSADSHHGQLELESVSGAGSLGPEPFLDPTASAVDSDLGPWTEVGPRSRLLEMTLGDYSYVMSDCQVERATLGKFCSIASHVRIGPGNHPTWRPSQHHFSYRSSQYGLGSDDADFFDWRRSHPVVIGHDVWVGHGAVVLAGVRIGTGAVIGAGAVVTRDVPEYMIAAGVPAAPLRERFSEDIRQALLRIRWWDWPREQLQKALEDFRQPDVRSFIATYDPGVSAES